MKEYEYYMYSPGGNDTALVLENVESTKIKKVISDMVMEQNSKIEQVGFIDKNQKKLVMAGNEFCANAARCAIYEYLNGRKGEMDIKVSGCKSILHGGIRGENVYLEYPHCL